MTTPIRPLTREEAIPPSIPASAEVRAAVAAYEAARAEQYEVEAAYGIWDEESHDAFHVAEECWRALEDLLCRLALTGGRAWHRVGDCEWGLKQGRGSGFELMKRSATPTRR